MPTPLVQNIEVQNNTQNQFTEPPLVTNNNSIPPTPTFQTTEESNDTEIDDCDKKSANIRMGYIVKHRIYPKHKFITRSDDLRYDNSPDGKSICTTYLNVLQLSESRDKVKSRRLWENVRDCIPLSLNTQQNNTNKAIPDITFDSKYYDEFSTNVPLTHSHHSNKQSCSSHYPKALKKRR